MQELLHKILLAEMLAKFLLFTHNSSNRRFGGFMSAHRSSKFQLGLMIAMVLSASMWPAASRAYTPEQQQACSGDAMNLCGAYVPDVDRITVCMIQKRSQLSPGCRAHFRPEPLSDVTSINAGKPLSIKPATRRKPVHAKPRKSRKSAKPAGT